MKKHIVAAGALFAFASSTFVLANDVEKYMGVPEEMKASSLWENTWQVGYNYEQDASFSFCSKFKAKTKEDAAIWRKVLARAGFSGAENTLLLNGDTSMVTLPLKKGDDNNGLVLHRAYLYSEVQQNLYLDVDEAGLLVNLIMGTLVKEDGKLGKEFDELIQKTIKGGWTLIGFAAQYFGSPVPPEIDILVDIVVDDIHPGEWFEKKIRRTLRSYGMNMTTLYGKPVYEVSDKGKARELLGRVSELAHIFCELSEEFNHRDYLILTDVEKKTTGRKVTAHSLKMLAEARKEAEKKEKSFDSFVSDVKTSTVDCGIVAEGVFARESFGYSEKLFGGKQRSVGDVWITDSDFMNSFLHPDLKGKFEGRIVLSYEGDIQIEDKWGTPFKAKKIVMKRKFNDGNRDHRTTVRYEEEKLKVDLDAENSSVVFYVDDDYVLVRKAEIRVETADSKIKELPESIFTKGLECDGDIVFTMNYNCRKKQLSSSK